MFNLKHSVKLTEEFRYDVYALYRDHEFKYNIRRFISPFNRNRSRINIFKSNITDKEHIFKFVHNINTSSFSSKKHIIL